MIKQEDRILKDIRDRYALAWRDWFYWPLEDDEGIKEARKRLDIVGKELDEYAKNKLKEAGE